jgi:hypothetical protein
MDADELRRLGHALVYRERLEARSVMSQVKPGEIRARHAAAIIELLDRDVMPGISHRFAQGGR